jgi:hypothetical protein
MTPASEAVRDQPSTVLPKRSRVKEKNPVEIIIVRPVTPLAPPGQGVQIEPWFLSFLFSWDLLLTIRNNWDIIDYSKLVGSVNL